MQVICEHRRSEFIARCLEAQLKSGQKELSPVMRSTVLFCAEDAVRARCNRCSSAGLNKKTGNPNKCKINLDDTTRDWYGMSRY